MASTQWDLAVCTSHLPSESSSQGPFGRLYLPQMLQPCFWFHLSLCMHASPQQEGQSFSASLEPRHDLQPLNKDSPRELIFMVSKGRWKDDMFPSDPKPCFFLGVLALRTQLPCCEDALHRVHWPAPGSWHHCLSTGMAVLEMSPGRLTR